VGDGALADGADLPVDEPAVSAEPWRVRQLSWLQRTLRRCDGAQRRVDAASLAPLLRAVAAAVVLAWLDVTQGGGVWRPQIGDQHTSASLALAIGLEGPCPSAAPLAPARVVALFLLLLALALAHGTTLQGADAFPPLGGAAQAHARPRKRTRTPNAAKDRQDDAFATDIHPFAPVASPRGLALLEVETAHGYER
jgi:hypothetical protein